MHDKDYNYRKYRNGGGFILTLLIAHGIITNVAD